MIIGLIAVVFSTSILMKDNKTVSLFSWENQVYQENQIDKLFGLMNQLSVTRLYQQFPNEGINTNDILTLLQRSDESNIDVYYLTGDGTWGLDEMAVDMKTKIDEIDILNHTSAKEFPIKGIYFDVETYLTEQWIQNPKESFNNYVNAMVTGYRYAKSKGLRVIVCIPNWLDEVNIDSLDNLIQYACDEIAIMNYDKRNEINAIKEEVLLSKKYHKNLECIFEFQKEGYHQLTSNETYYTDGLDVAMHNFDLLRDYYQDASISFAYHYVNPLYEILER